MTKAESFVVRLSPSNAERGAGVSCECETGERFSETDIFTQRQHLKRPAEHFRMQQSLQGAFRFSVFISMVNLTA